MEYYQISVNGISNSPGSVLANEGPVFALLITVDITTEKVTWVKVYDYDTSLTYSGPPVENILGTGVFNRSTLKPSSAIIFPTPPNFKSVFSTFGATFNPPDDYLAFSYVGPNYQVDCSSLEGSTGSMFISAGPDVETISTSCLTDNCQILTDRGLLPVRDLQPGHQVYDHQNKPSTIVKIWKSRVLSFADIVAIDQIECTMDHEIGYRNEWMPASVLSQSFLPQKPRLLYQIQTDSYGVWSTDYIISTWTDDYISRHPFDVSNFF